MFQKSAMVHLAEISHAPPLSPPPSTPAYSMLQYTGRVVTVKFVPRNCLRYLQITLIMWGGGLVSEFM